MHNCNRIIRKRQSCQRGCERHPFASRKIVGLENCLDQVSTDKFDRSLGKAITNRLLTVVGKWLVGRNVQFIESDSRKSFDGMRQRINTAIGRGSGRTSESQLRVNNRKLGAQVMAEATDFRLIHRVC